MLFLGNDIVAQVWSFSNSMKDIPYLIKKESNYKTQKGWKLKCNCPASTYRGASACKHIIAFNLSIKSDIILADDRFNLSDLGKELFRIR